MWRDSILSQLLCHFSNLRVICVYMCLPTASARVEEEEVDDEEASKKLSARLFLKTGN